MKMNRKNRFLIALFTISSLFFASCEIGLGAAVDLEAPKVTITSHQDNDSVPEAFSLTGTLYDNEEVTLFNIDFEDADLHFQIVPGGDWQKKTSKSNGWQTITSDQNNFCVKEDKTWKWSVGVNTDEKAADKQGHTYNLLAMATDARNNIGKESKVDLSLIVDTSSPDVSIYKPEIFSTYTDLKSNVDGGKYQLKDGNVISSLLNGTIQLFGRQEQALAFKALRIEFDNGIIEGARSTPNSTVSVDSIEDILNLNDAQIPDASAPTVYFSKTLTGDELREWNLTVKPEEWATNSTGIANGLDKDLHIIRIISTSISTSNAWQRKVLGYFLWYPQADKPWITMAIGDDEELDVGATECFPGSNISGNIQDDDGITSFVSTIYKKDAVEGYQLYTYSDTTISNPKTHSLPQTSSGEKSKYSAWTIIAPTENGQYKMVLEVTDCYGTKETITKYFKTSDVSAPRINIDSPLNNTPAVMDAAGNVSFTGSVTDDGKIESFIMVWLNPAKRDDPNIKKTYLNGSDPAWTVDWSNADANGFVEDSNKNKLYKFNVTQGQREYTLNKTFNLFTAFGIGQSYTENDVQYEKLLTTQDFVFRASDGHSETIKTISLTGDTSAPEIKFTKIVIEGNEKSLSSGSPQAFPYSANGKQAIIYGTWSDKFTETINNTSKFFDDEFIVSWGTGEQKKTVKALRLSNGTWTATIDKAPNAGGTITASIRDFGGNTKTIQTAARIETSDLGLSRISCLEDEGAYSTGILHITMEFTKNTNITLAKDAQNEDKLPTLTLNNGGTATFVKDYGEGYGSGFPVHVYEYEIAEGDDIDALSVDSINQNNAKWEDSALVAQGNLEDADVTDKVTIEKLPSNLNDSCTIKIDTEKPTISSITTLSSNGTDDWYKAGSTILLLMEFSEEVNIKNENTIKINFKHKRNGNTVTTNSASKSGSKSILFEYNVQKGDNTASLTCSSVASGTGIVTDLAGNTLSDWTITETSLGVQIDTEKPDVPSFGDWNPGVVFDQEGTTFTLTTDESDPDLEYTLNSGVEWLPYTGPVKLVNDGIYHVNARQTDAAGNTSVYEEVAENHEDYAAYQSYINNEKTFTIEKGDLITRITAETPSGTYSTNTTPNIITGRIEFRKSVTIGKSATVTLNVKNGSNTSKTIPIKECVASASENNVFTFDYEISSGDSINATDGLLDVTGWDLKSPTFKRLDNEVVPVTISFPAAGTNKRLNKNRSIKVLTGNPVIANGKITLSGTTLTIEFDREVSKNSGSITITQDTTTGNYHVPAVLSVDEYNELITINSIKSTIEGAYTRGVNGAEINSDSTLTNDTTPKYVLNFETDDTNSDLVSAFTTSAGKHIVTVSVTADEVSISNDKKKLIVNLTGNYKLPVKGASYTVNVPEGIVKDEVQNPNTSKSGSVTLSGVEAPVIRIDRAKYTINNISSTKTVAQNTADATVDMTTAQSARIRIDCRTPDVTLKYSTNETVSAVKEVNARSTVFDTKTADPTVAAINTNYTLNSKISLATDKAVNTYNAASGVKVAIAAQATKNNVTSDISYEFATRTVLKFHIQNYWNNGNDIRQYRVWVLGGDSPYGGNTNDTFPLSWGDPKNPDPNGSSRFMLMNGKFANNTMQSDWYLVTWDITQQTYHGFAAGTVPYDAMQNGPTKWYIGENCWTSQKSCYILYPGETLLMNTANVTPEYWFREDRENPRP